MGTTNTNAGKQAGGCGGCLLAILGVGIFIALPYYFYDIHGVQTLHAGDASRFDPIASLTHASALAQDGEKLEFLQMTARFVRSDGTLDLEADYSPVVVYQWIGTATADNLPVGAGGGTRRELVIVRATAFGFEHAATLPGGEKYYNLNMGLRRTESWLATKVDPAPPPKCGLGGLWKHAIAGGADPKAVAIVHYNAAGYDFQIEGTPFHMSFGADCKPRK